MERIRVHNPDLSGGKLQTDAPRYKCSFISRHDSNALVLPEENWVENIERNYDSGEKIKGLKPRNQHLRRKNRRFLRARGSAFLPQKPLALGQKIQVRISI